MTFSGEKIWVSSKNFSDLPISLKIAGQVTLDDTHEGIHVYLCIMQHLLIYYLILTVFLEIHRHQYKVREVTLKARNTMALHMSDHA